MLATGIVEVHVQTLLLAREDVPNLVGLVVERHIRAALLRIGDLVIGA